MTDTTLTDHTTTDNTSDAEKPSVLYIDDEAPNLSSFKAVFRPYYNIYLAQNAQEGTEILRTHHDIELVITDQRMPEITGSQFLKKINKEFPFVVRIILTGFSDIEAVIDAINSGAVYQYVQKPWEPSHFKKIIDSGIRLSRLEKNNTLLLDKLGNALIEKENTLKAFKKYVPENVIEKTMKQNQENIFVGERREIAPMFVDIRNFTSISEAYETQTIVTVLNDFYSISNTIIQKHHGIINKYLGDGFLAIFGAPVLAEDIEHDSVYSAIEIIRELEQINKKYSNVLSIKICAGIGISKGTAIVGNVGSDIHIEYTAIGRCVNLAARLEDLSKVHDNSIIVDENIYKNTLASFDYTQLDQQVIKGFVAPMDIFMVNLKENNVKK